MSRVLDVNTLNEAERTVHRALFIMNIVTKVCRLIPVIVIATTAPSIYAAISGFLGHNIVAGIFFSLLACGGLLFLAQIYQSHRKYKKARQEYRKRKSRQRHVLERQRQTIWTEEHGRTDAA
jgi:hypothetical protein